MPRSVVLALIVVHGLAVAALAVAVGWTHDKPRPCRKTFERVQVGMTRQEVVATVGGLPGNYSSADWELSRPFRIPGGDAVWICDADELRVWYTDDGHVSGMLVDSSRSSRLPYRVDRVWTWVTTGDDSPNYLFTRRAVGPYDLDALRDILVP